VSTIQSRSLSPVLPGFFFEYSSRARLNWCARQTHPGVEHASGFFWFGTSRLRVSLTRQPGEVVPLLVRPGVARRWSRAEALVAPGASSLKSSVNLLA
jgi:hypothetical protein